MTDLAHSVGVMEETFLDWVTPRRVVVGMGITLGGWALYTASILTIYGVAS